MSRSLGYIRKFIIFKKDYSNMHRYNPRGHGKIEVKGLKGNITINIENAESDNFYNIAFVGKGNIEVVGKIYTEENGKGKSDIVYNLGDLEARGFSAEDINGILIFRDTDVLLGAYIGKEDNSIEEFIDKLSEESIYTKVEEVVLEEEEISGEKEVPEELTQMPQEFVEVVESTIGTIPDVLPPIEEHYPEESSEIYKSEEYVPDEYMVPAKEYVSEETMASAIEAIPEEYMIPAVESIPEELTPVPPCEESLIGHTPATEFVPEHTFTYDSVVQMSSSTTYDYDIIELNRKTTQKNQTTDYILSILRYFPYTEPFTLDLYGYNWWRIEFDDAEDPRGFLPYFSLLIGGDQKNKKVNDRSTTAKDLMKRYGHYIFGLYNMNDEVKFYVYGVPGGFYKDEHPHKGTTGFNTWFEGKEVGGYWLLYIDPLHGKIIYPANPMTPNK